MLKMIPNLLYLFACVFSPSFLEQPSLPFIIIKRLYKKTTTQNHFINASCRDDAFYGSSGSKYPSGVVKKNTCTELAIFFPFSVSFIFSCEGETISNSGGPIRKAVSRLVPGKRFSFAKRAMGGGRGRGRIRRK